MPYLNTGEIRSANGLDGHQVGRARAGVRADRRYVTIPPLREAALVAREQAGQRDAREIDACMNYLTRLKARASESSWDLAVEFTGDPDKMDAAEKIARHWLRAIGPACRIEWADATRSVMAVYDPLTGVWKDL